MKEKKAKVKKVKSKKQGKLEKAFSEAVVKTVEQLKGFFGGSAGTLTPPADNVGKSPPDNGEVK